MLMGSKGIFKERPEEFGSFTPNRLSAEEMSRALCAAMGCGDRAIVNLSVPNGFMPICGVHAVVCHLLLLSALGDSLPAHGAREYARLLGADWDRIVRAEPRYPTTPEKFRCLNCGGGMKKVGDASGRTQYLHDCEG